MEKVISKSRSNVIPIIICLVIGVSLLLGNQSFLPVWVSYIFLAGAIFIFLSIRVTTIDPYELSFKFIWQKKGRTIRKEDIKVIKKFKVGNTTAHRSGMISKDSWIEIKGKKKRDVFYITQKGEKKYDEIYEVLINHYNHLFEKEN